MNAIDVLKLSSAMPVKTVDAAAKTKSEGSTEAGAFLKLLSSASKEESGKSEQEIAGTLSEIEAAVAELLQLPPEELQPEQQELIASVIQLLSLYQQHTTEHTQEKKLIRVNFEPAYTLEFNELSDEPKTDAPIQKKLEQLVQQIAQKMQELNDDNAKEFADVPIFMGGKKEYILSSPNKINEVLTLLLATAEKLEAMPAQQRIATASKLESSAQELLKLFSGSIEESELPNEPKRNFNLPLFTKSNLEQPQVTESNETVQKPVDLSSLETASPLETTKKDPPASAPTTNSLDNMDIEQTATIPGVRSDSVKSGQTTPALSATPIEAGNGDQAVPLATTNPVEAVKAAPAKQETPVARLTNLTDDLTQVISSSAKLTGTGETAQLKVSIFPEHLGHLEIRLSTVDGKMAAQILTSTPMAKEALELQVYQLRSSLVQQGIQVDRIEITTQQQAGQTSSQQQSQQEQRFARQQKQQSSSKNNYQQTGEETSGGVRATSSTERVMAVDYTI